MTLKNVERPTWPQVFALITLVGGGGAIGARQMVAPASEDRARVERARVVDNGELVEALAKIQGGLDELSKDVHGLTVKVAVIEERQRQGRSR